MSQFKTSVILCIQNFAKNDTENAELADAQTAAFSVSTQKPVHQESLRSFSGETDTDDNYGHS